MNIRRGGDKGKMDPLLKAQLEYHDCLLLLELSMRSAGMRWKATYCLRCKDCPVGHPGSVHKVNLGRDYVLVLPDGTKAPPEAYTSFGAYWKRLHTLARWGGDFDLDGDGKRLDDPGHFSFEWGGVK